MYSSYVTERNPVKQPRIVPQQVQQQVHRQQQRN